MQDNPSNWERHTNRDIDNANATDDMVSEQRQHIARAVLRKLIILVFLGLLSLAVYGSSVSNYILLAIGAGGFAGLIIIPIVIGAIVKGIVGRIKTKRVKADNDEIDNVSDMEYNRLSYVDNRRLGDWQDNPTGNNIVLDPPRANIGSRADNVNNTATMSNQKRPVKVVIADILSILFGLGLLGLVMYGYAIGSYVWIAIGFGGVGMIIVLPLRTKTKDVDEYKNDIDDNIS